MTSPSRSSWTSCPPDGGECSRGTAKATSAGRGLLKWPAPVVGRWPRTFGSEPGAAPRRTGHEPAVLRARWAPQREGVNGRIERGGGAADRRRPHQRQARPRRLRQRPRRSAACRRARCELAGLGAGFSPVPTAGRRSERPATRHRPMIALLPTWAPGALGHAQGLYLNPHWPLAVPPASGLARQPSRPSSPAPVSEPGWNCRPRCSAHSGPGWLEPSGGGADWLSDPGHGPWPELVQGWPRFRAGTPSSNWRGRGARRRGRSLSCPGP